MVPLTPERTYRFLDYFFGAGRRAGLDRRPDGLRHQVGVEDRGLVEGVHRGHGHRSARARRACMGHSEQLIGHFQQLTAAALAD